MRRALIAAAIFTALLGGGDAYAVPVGFTDRAAFDAAVTTFQAPQTVDFDAAASGTLITSGTTFGGVTFTYSIEDILLRITNAFDTSSGPNSLGLNSADEAFRGGDGFGMAFNRTVHAVGLYVLAEDLFPSDITLTIGTGGSVANGAADPAVTLSDGQAFFLGLVDTDGFTTADLSSFPENYVFNVDDIYTAVFSPDSTPVPEPTTLALCTAAGLGVVAWRRRRAWPSLAVGVAVVLTVFGFSPRRADAQCLVGEVVFWGGTFAPVGWLPVDGSVRLIAAHQQLFNVIGTTFGGDGVTTFAVPDLRGRTPLGTGQGIGLTNRLLGPTGGAETVTLTPEQLASHSHSARASGNVATSADPHGNLWAAQSRTPFFAPAGNLVPMSESAVAAAGGGQAHENMSPFLTLTPLICASGTAPVQR